MKLQLFLTKPGAEDDHVVRARIAHGLQERGHVGDQGRQASSKDDAAELPSVPVDPRWSGSRSKFGRYGGDLLYEERANHGQENHLT